MEDEFMRVRTHFTIPLIGTLGLLLLTDVPARACCCIPASVFGYYTRSIPGPPVARNDLHVDLDDALKEGSTPTSSPKFPTITVGQGRTSIDLSGTTINAGQAVEITYRAVGKPEIGSGYWTQNGVRKEDINVDMIKKVSLDGVLNPNGTVTVQLDNQTGGALGYAGLSIYTGANLSSATESNYLTQLANSGTPVSLLVPSSGTFPTGITSLATCVPSTDGRSSDGGSVSLDGLAFGEATEVIPTPEPGTFILLATSMPAVYFIYRRRARLNP
jgi:hypothetical protein